MEAVCRPEELVPVVVVTKLGLCIALLCSHHFEDGLDDVGEELALLGGRVR